MIRLFEILLFREGYITVMEKEVWRKFRYDEDVLDVRGEGKRGRGGGGERRRLGWEEVGAQRPALGTGESDREEIVD